jgi:hypothetical protein
MSQHQSALRKVAQKCPDFQQTTWRYIPEDGNLNAFTNVVTKYELCQDFQYTYEDG